MAEWWEKNGETSKAFNDARDAVPGGNPAFLTHDDQQLEDWREHLVQQREKPAAEQHLTIGGEDEHVAHQRATEEREQLIREIEAEQLHRLMLEQDREAARDRDDGQER